MAVPPRTRRLVFERDGSQCIVCGSGYELTIQHRVNRQMGGSKHRDGAANLIAMCLRHNQLLEADAEFADIGRECGWKAASWMVPRDVMVFYPLEGAWFYLENNGARTRPEHQEPRPAAAGLFHI